MEISCLCVHSGTESHWTSNGRSTAERMYGHVENHPQIHGRWRNAGPTSVQKVS